MDKCEKSYGYYFIVEYRKIIKYNNLLISNACTRIKQTINLKCIDINYILLYHI